MKINDLVSLYVSYIEGPGGKKRPVLVRKVSKDRVMAFKITTKYAHKSKFIQQQYYKIQDWKIVGLNRPSWIDVGNVYSFPKVGLTFKKIGQLTVRDQIDLDKFNVKFKEKRNRK
ncbi:hypothetical protein [Lactiplantibacillus mudanjiangensis]|uniref:Uncharacterized protein n=1 Tax=Lactiplantibacillus mudanjiangensis TaxID=1296538 RepID=A0A660E112_9LACO|nr:hypothetical protein MUDAN_BIHEEGNE_01450 [Lactiplantibacillus mudanjiangensis]VDG24395.1 hypothetical protein MUDAN_IGPPGNFN_02640 [Lactiplantibacillus mudanjiangensis]VDG28197.1 hypothetical protein MUDAN_MDHGFNIF_02919 [Lactiplantibacillus mudanjiangensis]VDG31153.1 hypothetical protein MUDAN_DOGOELCO_00654 [Lactiplantibacillus mudanjiangensis]